MIRTVIVVVADLAVTMFLAGEIRSVVSVNLILMQVLFCFWDIREREHGYIIHEQRDSIFDCLI